MRDDELSEKMVGLYTQMNNKLYQLRALERSVEQCFFYGIRNVEGYSGCFANNIF